MNRNPWIFQDHDETTDGEMVLASSVTDSAGREIVTSWPSVKFDQIVVVRKDAARTLLLAPAAAEVARCARAVVSADSKASWRAHQELAAAVRIYEGEARRLSDEEGLS